MDLRNLTPLKSSLAHSIESTDRSRIMFGSLLMLSERKAFNWLGTYYIDKVQKHSISISTNARIDI